MKTKLARKTNEIRVAAKISRQAFIAFEAIAKEHGQTPASRLRLILETNPTRTP